MERRFIIENGDDLVRAEKWVKRALSETYLNINRANHGKILYFEAHFVIKEVADVVDSFSTDKDTNG